MARLASYRSSLLPLLLLCTACSAVGEVTPETAATGAEQRLSALTSLDEKVARVAQRLSDANVDLCPVVRLSAGWSLHSARQYSGELRPWAIARFNLMGDLPGVLAAPEGSAAAEAGLAAGDLITAVDGQTLQPGEDAGPPEFQGLASNLAVLDAALARGTASLSVRRGGRERIAAVTPRPACGYDVQLNPSDELNARADGRRLFISTALAGFAADDDELAVILGHELAHHVLRHRSWSETGGQGRSANEDAGTPDGGPGNAEQQADRVGLFLAARAGYDPNAAARFWRRFGASSWRVRYPQLGHASAGARAQALEGVAAEIAARRAAGADLKP